ncbi:MAG: DEAD/DEAH box helicase [Candidatus Aenigmarchaeota archaeon]|nr:DEAD/DEAH box helicase [Candidatus Aenigmarchaeota archaeon]
MDVVQKVLEISGIESLNPVQELALKSGLLSDRNMVVAAPTASGKTVIAEIAALDAIKRGKKVVYIVPLRALASEKYEDFREKYGQLGVKVVMSIGDLDSSDPWLGRYDIIIATSEKLDSLMRHGIPWLDSIGLVIADEIHLLDSPNRGPTLEVVLTRLRQTCNPRILALSATISNYKDLAEWLDAIPVKSDYRPVQLYMGVAHGGKINFMPRKTMEVDSENPILDMVRKTIEMKKQILIFISTRKSAESLAEKIGKSVNLDSRELHQLNGLSEKILHSLEHPTKQCERLADCIRTGVAFHHAGLANRQRSLIEKAFRDGVLKVITATPTLAAGINLPAFRVLIRDLKRFSSFRGMDYIPVLEIHQMAGRAGRPKYDSSGEAILITKTEAEAKYAWERYVNGEAEMIYSKLGVEPVLRTHVLSLIASGVTPSRKSLLDFFFRTFYAHQYRELRHIETLLERVVDMLENFKFIIASRDNAPANNPFRPATASADYDLAPTKIGRRVSELYIDPYTADYIIRNVRKAEGLKTNAFGLLQLISNTVEMKPLLSIRRNDFPLVNELLIEHEKSLLQPVPNAWDIEYDDFLRSMKTAQMFHSWCNEYGENRMLEDFGVTPGELRARLDNADWLLYAAQELGLLLGYMDILKMVRKTRVRLQYGVKEELLPLIRLKGIGRARARVLYDIGLKGLAELRKVPEDSLARVVGHAVAKSVKEQLGEKDDQKIIGDHDNE